MKRLALFVLVLIFATSAAALMQNRMSGVRYAAAPAAGGTPEDFTARDSCKGLYFLTSTSTTDHCDAAGQAGDDALTLSSGSPTTSNTDLPPNVTTSSTFYMTDLENGDVYAQSSVDSAFGASDFTYCTWLETESATLSSQDYGWRGNGGFGTGWRLGYRFSGGTDTFAGVHGSSIESGTTSYTDWQHVCIRYDDGGSDTITLLVDGVEDCASTCPTADGLTTDASQAVSFGPDGTDGHLYEAIYFGEALSDAEICQICRCGADDSIADRDSTCGSCSMGSGACTN